MIEKPNPIVNSTTELSVSQLSEVLKTVVETAFAKVRIKGEISGLKKHSNGHYYFDLKESFGGKDYILKSVVWKWTRLSTIPENGLEVVATGKITTYAGQSNYQLTVEAIEVSGIGALLKQIEERKARLSKEGLFDQSKKKSIPFMPKIIGVVTSPTGSVIKDIIHRITERFPTRIIVYPVPVQGSGADVYISNAINHFNTMEESIRPTVIIVARGGGSFQDLMPFNEENVVRATANSVIPIISAVGHETDTTLIDFASDLRAPTPTGAAEYATPVKIEVEQLLLTKEKRIRTSIYNFIEKHGLKLQASSSKILTPSRIIEEYLRIIDEKTDKIQRIIKQKFELASNKITSFNSLLQSYSFKNVLKRGFAIIRDKNDKLITSLESSQNQEINEIEFFDGKVQVQTKLKQGTLL